MKRFFFGTIIFFSTSLMAQELATEQSRFKGPIRGDTFEGVRVAIVKPLASINISAKGKSASGGVHESTGFSLGYMTYTAGDVGWSTNIMYAPLMSPQFAHIGNMTRIDLNVVKGVDQAHIKAGINISTISNSPFVSRVAAALGYQASVGLMVTKNIGLDLGYSEMNQGGTFDMKEAGPEFSISATF